MPVLAAIDSPLCKPQKMSIRPPEYKPPPRRAYTDLGWIFAAVEQQDLKWTIGACDPIDQLMRIQIEPHADLRAAPLRLYRGKRRIDIIEIVDQWNGPGYRYVKSEGMTIACTSSVASATIQAACCFVADPATPNCPSMRNCMP